MDWITYGLNRKFVIGTAAGLLISSLVFLLLFITMYRSELEHERAETVTQVNNLLQTSLENAMLKRDLDGLRTIVDRLGSQSNITGVMIVNPKGEIRFSNHAEKIHQQLDMHQLLTESPATQFTRDQAGNEVLRSIKPVYNKVPCTECHGPIEQNPLNGILLIDYDAASIRQKAQKTILMLMGSGALIVIINITGGWWFIRRYVLTPVNQLATATNALSRGELDFRLNLSGKDELSQLGNTFDRMAESLQSKIRQLEEKENFLQALVDAIPDGIRIIDEDYRLLLFNRAYREQLRLDDEVTDKLTCYASSHRRDEPCPSTLITCPLAVIKENQQPLKLLHEHHRADGSKMEVEVYAAPMQITIDGKPRTLVVESIRDLAEQVKFSHEQKLSELGRLAAGVSHEIHNPLTAVRLALHAVSQEVKGLESNTNEICRYLELVDHEIDQCIDVSERLLKLSTAPPSQPELVSVNETVEETISLLRWEAEQTGIELVTLFGNTPLRVIASDSELRMLTLNLAQNAFHAMPNGGKLEVSAKQSNNEILIYFRDTGAGITEENLPHIFEPFFSRRATGERGTGLGLSISKAIVENYGGSLGFESIPGSGSCFTIRLPDAKEYRGN